MNSMAYTVNGTGMMMDVTPEMNNDKLYIPLRFLAEALGGKVAWDPENSEKTTITLGSSTLVFKQDEEIMNFNGTPKDMGAKVHLFGERMVVHSRFIADILGWNLKWNGDDQTVNFWK